MARRRRATARRPAYPLRMFGKHLTALLIATSRSHRAVADEIGISQPTISAYIHGYHLPADAAAVERIADAVASSKAKARKVRAELLALWQADMWDADLRARGISVAEARAALDAVERARK